MLNNSSAASDLLFAANCLPKTSWSAFGFAALATAATTEPSSSLDIVGWDWAAAELATTEPAAASATGRLARPPSSLDWSGKIGQASSTKPELTAASKLKMIMAVV